MPMINNVRTQPAMIGVDVLVWIDTIWTPAFLLANREEWAILDPDFGHVPIKQYPYWMSMPAGPKKNVRA